MEEIEHKDHADDLEYSEHPEKPMNANTSPVKATKKIYQVPDRIEYARDRARLLSKKKGSLVLAVRVGTIFGPTERAEGYDELFGAFLNGEEA